MTGFIIKLLSCPIILLISDALFNGINYNNVYQPIIVGVVLAVLAHGMEVLLLRKGTFWISNTADLVTAFLIIWISQLFLPGARVTFLGALLPAVLLAVAEYVLHMYLIRSGKWAKANK